MSATTKTATVEETQAIADLSISSDLDAEFQKQSTLFAHYAFLAARAYDMVRRREELTEMLFYKLYAAYRKTHSNAKENDCKSYIRRNAEYKKAMRLQRRAQHNADLLKAAVRAFEMRRDMLIQLGAMFRLEQGATDMSLKQKIGAANKRIRKTYKGKRKGE